MLGELSREQIEQVLRSEVLGRIGCHAEGRTYIVPTSYAYDGTFVYARSSDGLKIRTMRANASVCFEVEQVDDLANWRSVVAWGTYEELAGADEEHAVKLLAERFAPLTTSESALPAHGADAPPAGPGKKRAVVFRLRLTDKTGRFEKR